MKVKPNKISAKRIIGVIDIDTIPPLPATKITSGLFAVATIPPLPATKITTGVFDIATIPPLPATKITTGVFDIATIPNLNSSKITEIHSSKITNIPTRDPGTRSGIVWSHRGRLHLS